MALRHQLTPQRLAAVLKTQAQIRASHQGISRAKARNAAQATDQVSKAGRGQGRERSRISMPEVYPSDTSSLGF